MLVPGTHLKWLFPEYLLIPALKDYREDAILQTEKQYLENLVKHTEGNIKEACRISGLSRSRLYLLLKRYNISASV